MNLERLKALAQQVGDTLLSWLTSPQFYAQVGAIIVAVFVARLAARQLLARVAILRDEPAEGPLLKLRSFAYSCRDLLLPVLQVLALAAAAEACDAAVQSSWLVRLAESAAVIYVLYAAINRFIRHPAINGIARWVGIPVAALQVFGVLEDVTGFLDSIAFSAGNIRISVYALAKAAIFGGILFWLGRVSSNAGQKVIRDQKSIDIQTRELAAKFVEIAVFFIVGVLLLNILGLDLTALAVFGGALGVGLGFGLQQIASNFISGIIILLERSLKVGDFIELEGGQAGVLREINMRSSALATFDGKDIMVPNEKFITTTFVNWTKTDPTQRYEARFEVSYLADPHEVIQVVGDALAKCPGVMATPTVPACELKGFTETGVLFGAEFWVNGVGDAVSHVISEAHLTIWDCLKAAGIEMAGAVSERQNGLLSRLKPTAHKGPAKA